MYLVEMFMPLVFASICKLSFFKGSKENQKEAVVAEAAAAANKVICYLIRFNTARARREATPSLGSH